MLLALVLTACGGEAAPTAAPAAPAATRAATGGAATTSVGSTPAAPTTAASGMPTTAPAGMTIATTAAAPATTGAAGGTLTGGFNVGPGGAPQQFNPLTVGAGYMWLEKYYSKLLVYSDTTFTKLQGENAESFTASADAKTFTFKLRPNIKWHDGMPFTSADVQFSMTMAQDPSTGSVLSSRFKAVQEVQTPDPLTAVVVLSSANAGMLDSLAYLWMLPKHAFSSIAPKDLAKNAYWSANPVGTGPFKWSKYVPDQYLELVANDAYWRGRPKLDKLIDRYYKEPGSALIALRKGEIQFTYLTADEADSAKKEAGITVLSGPSQVTNYVSVNLQDPRLADVRVRQAMMYTLDRKTIVDQLFKGSAETLPCAFGNTLYQAKDANAYARDVSKAKSLLKEANWDAMKGEPLEILTYYNDQLSMDALVAMQQQLSDAGITVKIRAVDVPTYNSFTSTPEFAQGKGWSLIYAGGVNGPDPETVSQYFQSISYPPTGTNFAHFNNASVDMAFAAGRAETDTTKRAATYVGACKTLNEQLPWLPMWQTIRYGGVSKGVNGYVWTPSAGSGRYYDAAETWTVAK